MDFSQRNPIEKVFSTKNENVSIAGWIQQVRNLGGLRFVQLQDRTGIVQIVLEKDLRQVRAYAGLNKYQALP